MRKQVVVVASFVILFAIWVHATRPSAEPTVGRESGNAPVFPALISLPPGFGPEGIAVGRGSTFFVGSLTPPTLGQILIGDLRTGEFSELVAPTGRPAVGMKHDSRSNFLFVAGGQSGRGTVYDASSGHEIAFYQFQPPATSGINDVILTRDAAYFTTSQIPYLYRVALGPRGQPSGNFDVIPLPANFGVTGGCMGPPPVPAFKSNGIVADPSGTHLILVHTSEGQLYRVDTSSYTVVPIDLGGGDVCSGDGLLLDGKTLYVVQNFKNQIAVVELAPDLFSGTITRHISEPFASNPATKVPTTVAEFGNSLYAVTAGLAPPAPDFVVRVSK